MEITALTERLRQGPPKRVAVAAAHDRDVLKALLEAQRLGIAAPVLCGDIEKIDAIARLYNIDISSFEIVETDSDAQSAGVAVSLVKSGRADILMKGSLNTAELLKAMLDKNKGLLHGGILSHVAVLFSEERSSPLILTDGGVVIAPDLKTKARLVENAVAVAKGLGIENPKVAPVAAVETVNPDMQSTLDAAALSVMNARGQIKDCVVDGPLAFDVAVSAEAAKNKGISSPAAGCADILLFHSIEAANAACKAMTSTADFVMGGVIAGASAPAALASRSGSKASKLYSIAVAALI